MSLESINEMEQRLAARFPKPGIRLVLATAVAEPDEARCKWIRSLAAQVADWPNAVEIAERQGTAPLLYRNLSQHAPQLAPAEVLQNLRQRFFRNAARNMLMTSELAQIIDALRREGIRALTFKGPTLAALAYGDLGLREFGDVDLLVHPQDFDQAAGVLHGRGYRSVTKLPPEQLRGHVESLRQLCVVGRGGLVVELHSGLGGRGFSFAVDFEQLFARRQAMKVAGQSLPTFGCEDLVVYLAAHGAKHLWRRLKWMCDFSEMMKPEFQIEWAQVGALAKAARAERMVMLAAALSEGLFSRRVPHPLLEPLESRRAVDLLTVFAEQQPFAPQPSRLESVWFHWHIRNRRRDALRDIAHMTLAPHVPDWQWIPLPRPLWFLYGLLRPLRLMFNKPQRGC